MKLTIVTSSLSHGGSERTATEMANYFAKRNHKVSIITSKVSSETPFYKLVSGIETIGLEVLQRQAHSFFGKFLLIITRLFLIRKAVRIVDADVIISFIETMNVLTLTATLGLKKPVVVVEQSDPYFHKIPRLYGFLRVVLYPLSSKVVVMNKRVLKFFEKRFLKNCTVIPNPNRITTIKKKRISKHPKFVVTAGRLGNEKDHKTLIRSFPLVLKSFPKLSLYIYGEGELRNELQDLINVLKMESNIFLMGAKQNVEEYIEQGDLFVFPSIYEGCPLALLEAMALGVPSLVSNCDGNSEIIEHGIDGEMFQVGDVNELSDKIIELLTKSNKRQKYSEAGQARVIDYNPDIIFKKWEELFVNILRN